MTFRGLPSSSGNDRCADERRDYFAHGALEAHLRGEAGHLARPDPGHVVAQDRAVVAMEERNRVVRQQRGVRAVEHREQRAVRIQELPIQGHQSDPDRGMLERRPEPALALAQRALLLVQVDEDRDLRAQHERVERLQHVVHGARGVPAEDVMELLADRGQEDDRDVTRLLAPLDVGGGLEAVELGHLDVHQDQGELVAQEVTERLVPGARADEGLSEGFEHRLQRDQVLDLVVDQQDLRATGGAHRGPPPVMVGSSSARNGPIRSSSSTRRAAPSATAAAGISGRSAVAGSCATV